MLFVALFIIIVVSAGQAASLVIFGKAGRVSLNGNIMFAGKITAFRKTARVSLISLIAMSICLGICSQRVFGQTGTGIPLADSFDIKKYSFNLPQPLPKGKFSQTLSVFYVVPPEIWTLDMVQAPMLNYAAKYTLGKGFNLQGSVSTLVISNRINAGPFWNYSHKNLHFGLGYQLAFNFGMLNHFGFQTVLTGWEQQPSFTFGYSFRKTALVFRADLYYITAMQIYEGGNKIDYDDDYINGYSITASFEQRLHKNLIMTMGLKMDYFRYHILAWPAFPVNNYRYWIPEFQIGIEF